ncbi:MAG: hypothetical protein ABSH14_13945 [Verrucomicrobiia bacterium]|jgi:hypothetical protein
MKNSLIAKASLLTTLLVITGCATSKQAPAPLPAAKVYRITCRATSTSSHLNMFVATGSLAHPLVALADNNGYPPVRELYARPLKYRGMDGISISVFFDGPALGKEIAVNVLQQGMTSDYQLMLMSP